MNAAELRTHMESPPEGHRHRQPGRPGLFARVPDDALEEIHEKALHYSGEYTEIALNWDRDLESDEVFWARAQKAMTDALDGGRPVTCKVAVWGKS